MPISSDRQASRVEGDVRLHPRMTLSGFGGVHLGALHQHAETAGDQDNRVPQVPTIRLVRGHCRDAEGRYVLGPGPLRRLAGPRTT